jgi:spore coat protein CotH
MKQLPLVIRLALLFLPLGAAAQNAGNALFGAPVVHDVYLTFSQPGWWDSLTANYTADIYMRAAMVIDGTPYDTIGVKFKGNSSYNNPSKKKSFKIGIDEYVSGQKYDGLKKFNLNNHFKDPSFMREKLMCDFSLQMGAFGPRCTYARVYLNNVYWGLYNLVEEVDKTYLSQHFPDKKGNLFKGDPSGDLKWINGTQSSYYTKYELKTNETVNDWSDLVHLIDEINNTPVANFRDSLEAVMETTSALKAWALTNIFVNLDSYLGSGHNYYLYDDSTSLRFHYILWDVNEAFGNFSMGMSNSTLKSLSMFYISNPPSRPLYNKMVGNTTYKAALVNEFCYMMNYFNNALLDPKIDSLKNLIMADVQNDTNKFYSYNDFLNNITNDVVVQQGTGTQTIMGLKSFIQARNAALVNELATWNCFVGLVEAASPAAFALFPNPAAQQVSITAPAGIFTVEILDITGQAVQRHAAGGATSLEISVSELANGIYFIRVNGRAVKKLVLAR